MSNVTVSEIMDLIAAEFGVHPVAARVGSRRYKPADPPVEVLVRDAAVYLAQRHTQNSLRSVGRRLRCTYIETIARMGDRCAQRCRDDDDHAAAIERIERRIDVLHESRGSLADSRRRHPSATTEVRP